MKQFIIFLQFSIASVIVFLSPLNIAKKYDVIIERLVLVSNDETYVTNWTLFVRRKTRRSPYAVSGHFYSPYPAGNNITASLAVYSKLNSEYKPTGLNLKHPFCDWWEKDEIVFGYMKKYFTHPVTCPFQGFFEVKDIIIDPERLLKTGYFPYENIRLDFKFYSVATKKLILYYAAFMKFTEKPQWKETGQKNLKY